MRAISAFLLLHFLAVTVAPAWIVGEFLLERTRIEKELCVQRMVAEGQRTCHGECQLMKRLEHSNDKAHNLPTELQSLRLGEFIIGEEQLPLVLPPVGGDHLWSSMSEDVLEGHSRPRAPVPWC